MSHKTNRLRAQDVAVDIVDGLLMHFLAEKVIPITPEERNRIRYHPRWQEPSVRVEVRLAASNSDTETREQKFLFSVLVDEFGTSALE